MACDGFTLTDLLLAACAGAFGLYVLILTVYGSDDNDDA